MKCFFLTAITIARRQFAEGLNSQPSRRNLASRSATTSPIEMTTTMLAAIQMTSTNHKQSNLDKTVRLVDFAAANGAVFIALPECSSFIGGGTDSDSQGKGQHLDAIAASERLDGPYALALCALASRLNVWLSVGGFPEKIDHVNESGTVDKKQSLKVYNTNFMISPAGLVTSVYRKIHLFDCPMAGLIESKNTAAGDALVIADCGFARVGLTTCYDLRFPELYGALCRPLDNSDDAQHDRKSAMCGLGAEIVLVPSAFTVTTGIAHWETLLRARAIENQCYIVAAAQIGEHNNQRKSYGRACIIDPWGKIVSSCRSIMETEGTDIINNFDLEGAGSICLAPFDKEFLLSIRQKMPVQSHRRPDVYYKN